MSLFQRSRPSCRCMRGRWQTVCQMDHPTLALPLGGAAHHAHSHYWWPHTHIPSWLTFTRHTSMISNVRNGYEVNSCGELRVVSCTVLYRATSILTTAVVFKKMTFVIRCRLPLTLGWKVRWEMYSNIYITHSQTVTSYTDNWKRRERRWST